MSKTTDALAVGGGLLLGIVYIAISLAIPVLTIAGGIWFYNNVINDDEPTYTSQVQQADKLSATERQAYMDSCMSESGEASYCRCTLDHLEDRYTGSEIRGFGEASVDSIPQPLWDAVEACYHLADINEL